MNESRGNRPSRYPYKVGPKTRNTIKNSRKKFRESGFFETSKKITHGAKKEFGETFNSLKNIGYLTFEQSKQVVKDLTEGNIIITPFSSLDTEEQAEIRKLAQRNALDALENLTKYSILITSLGLVFILVPGGMIVIGYGTTLLKSLRNKYRSLKEILSENTNSNILLNFTKSSLSDLLRFKFDDFKKREKEK